MGSERRAADAITVLTSVGNAAGLPGRFGVQWGATQLLARIEAALSEVFEGPEELVALEAALEEVRGGG